MHIITDRLAPTKPAFQVLSAVEVTGESARATPTLYTWNKYSFYIDTSKKLNIGQVQKGHINMHFIQQRHGVV